MKNKTTMQLGMIGLGRMGANMVRRLIKGAPVPVLSSALFARFASRGEADGADTLLSAMPFQFGGHKEEPLGVRTSP